MTSQDISSLPDIESTSTIRLRIPADPRFLRLVRVTAAGLASRLEFTLDEIDDLRLALDELCFALFPESDDSRSAADAPLVMVDTPSTLELQYILSADAITIAGETTSTFSSPPHINEFSEIILESLVDEHDLVLEPDKSSFRLVKRRHK